jgi:hypothetical protein
LIIVISLCEGENLDGWTLLHISKNWRHVACDLPQKGQGRAPRVVRGCCLEGLSQNNFFLIFICNS